MPGVYRSSINLSRWRGAVPNALNAGRVEAFLGTGAITDVQAGVARESSVQTVNGIVNTINTNANNNATIFLAPTRDTVNGIAANGAQQSTLAATQGTVNAIAAQMSGAGVVAHHAGIQGTVSFGSAETEHDSSLAGLGAVSVNEIELVFTGPYTIADVSGRQWAVSCEVVAPTVVRFYKNPINLGASVGELVPSTHRFNARRVVLP